MALDCGSDSKSAFASANGCVISFVQMLLFVLFHERLIVSVEKPRLNLFRDKLTRGEAFPCIVNQILCCLNLARL